MRLDAVRTLKSVFAGTATSHFTDVIEAVFGVEEENPPPEAEETEETEDRGEMFPTKGLSTRMLQVLALNLVPLVRELNTKPTILPNKNPNVKAQNRSKLVFVR